MAESIKYMIANAVVFKKVKAALGLDKCALFYSAAAPTSKETLEYFMSLDIRILGLDSPNPTLCFYKLPIVAISYYLSKWGSV